MTPTDRALEVVSAVGALFTLGITLWAMPHMPDRVATHFDFFGRPDGWGPKEVLWVLPGSLLLLYVVLTIVCRFPHTFNYPVSITTENAERQYALAISAMRWLKAEFVVLLSYGAWATIQVALGQATDIGAWFVPVTLAVMLPTVAALLIRSYRAR